MKYLGIILDQKFRFQEHIKYAAERCAKLIHNLSRVARLSWGFKYEAIATIYKGAILPLLTYGAPVWIEAMKYEHNRQKYVRVQQLINLQMAKAYHTTSSKVLCILTGMTPITLKLEEVVKQYIFKEKQHQQALNLDYDMEHRHWPHLAKAVSIKEVETQEEATISAYTDGSKTQRGVGSGVVIFKGSNIIARQKLKLEDRCSNNQVEQLAIHKALEEMELLNRKNISPITAITDTDSRVSLESLHNPNNQAFLVEEIRKTVASLERSEWTIKFSWVKAHARTYGNEIAHRLAKEVV
jgi:ribonuclease HI